MSVGSLLYSHYLLNFFVTGQHQLTTVLVWMWQQRGSGDIKIKKYTLISESSTPLSQTCSNHTLTMCWKHVEEGKKHKYDERIKKVEHGTFSPLVFSTPGGVGPIALCFMKRMALLHSKKHQTTLQYYLKTFSM